MAMPNGKFKPVPKADAEQAKPIVIKPNYTKQAKRKFSATAPGAPAKPVYVKVCLSAVDLNQQQVFLFH